MEGFPRGGGGGRLTFEQLPRGFNNSQPNQLLNYEGHSPEGERGIPCVSVCELRGGGVGAHA